MTQSKLIEANYFDPAAQVRLTVYADTIITDRTPQGEEVITAIRFGGYPEVTRAMADAIYGGATIDVMRGNKTEHLRSLAKGYQRQLSHDGIYAAATLMANDDAQTAMEEDDDDDETNESAQPRKCYIFCPTGDQDRLFEELDHKTAAPLIPEFRDYVLDELAARGFLRKLKVTSIKEKLDAWVLELRPDDANVVQVLEDGLKSGKIAIPGADPAAPDGFENVDTVTSYLNTFGVTVADRIRNQFTPLFDPATEPLSEEVLAINSYVQEKADYSLYDAQLAVAEATKRQLDRKGTALIIAECGSGKTKIGATALGALYGMQAAQKQGQRQKSFTTLIFYSMGYNLFTLRQASRRSWRINQMASRVEVYMLYYADTMQAKAMKLMASKLAVAGIIEGSLTDEGLAAMSDVKDMTSQMAMELTLGIKDNVEDIAAAFKKMAIINPDREARNPVAPKETSSSMEPSGEATAAVAATRPVGTESKRALYEGLLERTMEERKKKKSKKVVVNENQLTLFDFAA